MRAGALYRVRTCAIRIPRGDSTPRSRGGTAAAGATPRRLPSSCSCWPFLLSRQVGPYQQAAAAGHDGQDSPSTTASFREHAWNTVEFCGSFHSRNAGFIFRGAAPKIEIAKRRLNHPQNLNFSSCQLSPPAPAPRTGVAWESWRSSSATWKCCLRCPRRRFIRHPKCSLQLSASHRAANPAGQM